MGVGRRQQISRGLMLVTTRGDRSRNRYIPTDLWTEKMRCKKEKEKTQVLYGLGLSHRSAPVGRVSVLSLSG